MTTPATVDLWGDITRALFPWAARFRAVGKRLAIRSAGEGIDLEGGTKGVVRVGDFVGRLYVDTIAKIVYYSPTETGPPYVWTAIASGIIPPIATDAGTAIVLPVGSDRVTAG